MEVIKDSNLKLADLITKSPMVMVVISTKWCAPCNNMTPIFEDLLKETPDMKVFKVDVTDEAPSFVSEMKIRSVPTILYYKDGVMKDTITGARTKEELKVIINR